MKTLTVEEFDALEFSFSVDSSEAHLELHTMPVGLGDEGETVYKERYESWVAGTCTATSGEISVKFCWVAQGGDESFREAHEFTIEFAHDPEFELIGAILVDDDGDDVSDPDFVISEKLKGESWEDLARAELPEMPGHEDIDFDEDDSMETYIVERDNDRSIRFTGERIASTTSRYNQNTNGRWTELALYRTKGGKLICEQIGVTQWQGERDRFSGAICDNNEEVIAFFGNGWLAKELYAEADIDTAIDIE